MRNENTVYWVSEAEDGSHEGHTTCRITLLLGTQVMEVPRVMTMENDHGMVQDMWEENLEAGCELRDVSEEEAKRLYRRRIRVEGEIQAEGQEAYHNGLDADENPYAPSEFDHEEWHEGWARAYAEERGEEYDPEEDARIENERERREYRADLAASKATLGRWFHEEMAGA
jgi:hypothetical protein